MKLLEDAKVVYSAGFFVTVSPDSIYTCAQKCLDDKKIYCMVRHQPCDDPTAAPYAVCCAWQCVLRLDLCAAS